MRSLVGNHDLTQPAKTLKLVLSNKPLISIKANCLLVPANKGEIYSYDVNCAKTQLSSLTEEVHRAAGPQLRSALEVIRYCRHCECKVTKSFNLQFPQNLLHVAPPTIILDKHTGQVPDARADMLKLCYKNALDEANRLKMRSVALPILSNADLGPNCRGQVAILTIEAILSWYVELGNAEPVGGDGPFQQLRIFGVHVEEIIFCCWHGIDSNILRQGLEAQELLVFEDK